MLTKVVNILGPADRFSDLKSEILTLVEKHADERNQVICQTKKPGSDDWYEGIGSIDDLEEKNEESYRFINPNLRGTQLEKFIEAFDGFRTRIMIMPPRQCYSVHADPTPRLHVPIITNDQCWMIWPFESCCKRLIEGYVHLVDTTKSHTFINGSGSEKRIHLMMCLSRKNFDSFIKST